MSKFWVIPNTREIFTVNGEHFMTDVITMSSAREFARGDKKN